MSACYFHIAIRDIRPTDMYSEITTTTHIQYNIYSCIHLGALRFQEAGKFGRKVAGAGVEKINHGNRSFALRQTVGNARAKVIKNEIWQLFGMPWKSDNIFYAKKYYLLPTEGVTFHIFSVCLYVSHFYAVRAARRVSKARAVLSNTKKLFISFLQCIYTYRYVVGIYVMDPNRNWKSRSFFL